jgi:flagella basal body P-ring formation protein FlgA
MTHGKVNLFNGHVNSSTSARTAQTERRHHKQPRLRGWYSSLILTLGFSLFCIVQVSLVAAEPIQSQESIRESARQFIARLAEREYHSPPEVKIGHLDARLMLTACTELLQTFLPPGGRTLGNTTVGVRCAGVKPWTLYVPAEVTVFRQIVITSRPLARGTTLTTADLRLAKRNLAKLRAGYLTDVSQALGNNIKRSLPMHTPLTASVLEAPHLIQRGEHVTLFSESSKVRVRVIAKALMDGALGDMIRVRNISSKQIVEAVVVSPGLVKVPKL